MSKKRQKVARERIQKAEQTACCLHSACIWGERLHVNRTKNLMHGMRSGNMLRKEARASI